MPQASYRAGSGSVAAIKGHPLHPMLVPVVIGAFVGAFLADVIYTSEGDIFWARSVVWLLLLTLAAAALAAIPGAIDLLSLPRARALKLAWLHAGGNVLFVVLTAINVLLRLPDYEPATSLPFVLSLISLALLGVTGWLGGELSYRHGVGVAPSVGAAAPAPEEARASAVSQAAARAPGLRKAR